jgi:uncharacterized protein
MDQFGAFAGSLANDLARLSPRHQLAFAASCCERAIPNYQRFSRQEGWGNPEVLRRALDYVWRLVGGERATAEELQERIDECRRVTPNLDDFGSVEAASAQEAAFSVLILLEYSSDANPRHAVRISGFSRDTIDMFVQMRDQVDPSSPSLDERVWTDSLMVREIQKQLSDVAQLQSLTLTQDAVAAFRGQATAGGLSHLGWS